MLKTPAAKKAFQDSDLMNHFEEPKVVQNVYMAIYKAEEATFADVFDQTTRQRIEGFDKFKQEYQKHFRALLANCSESKKALYKRLSIADLESAATLPRIKAEVEKNFESVKPHLPAELKGAYEKAKETYLTDFEVCKKLIESTLNSPSMNPALFHAFKSFLSNLEKFWGVQAAVWNISGEGVAEIDPKELYNSYSSNLTAAIDKASQLKKVDQNLYLEVVRNPCVDTLSKLVAKALNQHDRLLILQDQIPHEVLSLLKFVLGPSGAVNFLSALKKFEAEAEPLAQKKSPESYKEAIHSVQVDSKDIDGEIILNILDVGTWTNLFNNAGSKYDEVMKLFATAKELYLTIKPAIDSYGQHLVISTLSQGEKILTWKPPAKKAVGLNAVNTLNTDEIREKIGMESFKRVELIRNAKTSLLQTNNAPNPLQQFVSLAEVSFRQPVTEKNLLHYLLAGPLYENITDQKVKDFYKAILEDKIMRTAGELLQNVTEVQTVLDQNYPVSPLVIEKDKVQPLLIDAAFLNAKMRFSISGLKLNAASFPESFMAPGMQTIYDNNFGKITDDDERAKKVEEYFTAKMEELKPLLKQVTDYYDAFLKSEAQKEIKTIIKSA